MKDKKKKPSITEMWKFIDDVMRPHKLVPDKASLTDKQIFSIYSKLMKIDDLFREIEQVKILKKTLDEEERKKSIV